MRVNEVTEPGFHPGKAATCVFGEPRPICACNATASLHAYFVPLLLTFFTTGTFQTNNYPTWLPEK